MKFCVSPDPNQSDEEGESAFKDEEEYISNDEKEYYKKLIMTIGGNMAARKIAKPFCLEAIEAVKAGNF